MCSLFSVTNPAECPPYASAVGRNACGSAERRWRATDGGTPPGVHPTLATFARKDDGTGAKSDNTMKSTYALFAFQRSLNGDLRAKPLRF